MSATTEALYDKIRQLENEIKVITESGHDPKVARDLLKQLQEQLRSANEALTEGKTLLKG